MQWYYSKNGTQLGPVPQAELISKLASGEVSVSDLVWKEGMGDWVPASQVGELKSVSAIPPVGASSAPASPYNPPVAPYQPLGHPGASIPNYLWQAIVVTVLCCMPFGIPAIVFAAKVDGLVARGDIAGAMAASKKAKMWMLIALFSGLTVGILYGIAAGMAAASGSIPQ